MFASDDRILLLSRLGSAIIWGPSAAAWVQRIESHLQSTDDLEGLRHMVPVEHTERFERLLGFLVQHGVIEPASESSSRATTDESLPQRGHGLGGGSGRLASMHGRVITGNIVQVDSAEGDLESMRASVRLRWREGPIQPLSDVGRASIEVGLREPRGAEAKSPAALSVGRPLVIVEGSGASRGVVCFPHPFSTPLGQAGLEWEHERVSRMQDAPSIDPLNIGFSREGLFEGPFRLFSRDDSVVAHAPLVVRRTLVHDPMPSAASARAVAVRIAALSVRAAELGLVWWSAHRYSQLLPDPRRLFVGSMPLARADAEPGELIRSLARPGGSVVVGLDLQTRMPAEVPADRVYPRLGPRKRSGLFRTGDGVGETWDAAVLDSLRELCDGEASRARRSCVQSTQRKWTDIELSSDGEVALAALCARVGKATLFDHHASTDIPYMSIDDYGGRAIRFALTGPVAAEKALLKALWNTFERPCRGLHPFVDETLPVVESLAALPAQDLITALAGPDRRLIAVPLNTDPAIEGFAPYVIRTVLTNEGAP